jgi:glycosyltransferase involved in cell wall biosynthesis
MPVLRQEIQQRGLESVVELRGHLSREQVWVVLEELDLFALPSFDEGVPLSILEAMAQGLAVVATAVGGIPEVVRPGVNGLLVPAGDSEALAEAIQELAGDPERRRRMGEASRALWESNYTEAAVWPRWEALYRSLLDERGGEGRAANRNSRESPPHAERSLRGAPGGEGG